MKKILVILFGLIFAGIGAFLFVKGQEQAKRCTAETVGTVVEIKEEVGTETDEDNFERTTYTYYPVIEYEVEGRIVKKQYSVGSSSQKYRVNDKVDILYNPNNVEEYMIKGDKSTNIIGIVFIVLGLVVVVIGIIKEF